jgi:hypothetical protein
MRNSKKKELLRFKNIKEKKKKLGSFERVGINILLWDTLNMPFFFVQNKNVIKILICNINLNDPSNETNE